LTYKIHMMNNLNKRKQFTKKYEEYEPISITHMTMHNLES
jgi:hypothetical protein